VAPAIAINYWQSELPQDARQRDVVLIVREDEARHRDTNHNFANDLAGIPQSKPRPLVRE
jgi:ubiquinol oxidase